MTCPCQSGLAYAQCCAPYHRGRPAPTPQALMRARYSAYALGDTAYVKSSWHASTRPATLDLPAGDRWLGLTVVDSGETDDAGWVHFRAISRDDNGFAVLEEYSRFLREHGQWFYVDGEPTVTALEPGRNDPCPCGSGRKFKKCCAA
ncbi:YchJ family metal-binding protein [Salinisphaera sp. T5B8]|uniref:YchJ family protein n=1 Tax=Salinisphaera sp. T5B8 TaxID=1304154 RepID=UPI00333F104F